MRQLREGAVGDSRSGAVLAEGSLLTEGDWSCVMAPGTDRHSAIYDPVRDRMIVFGGLDGSFRNDTWVLSLAGTPTWTRILTTGTSPSARCAHTAIYDPVRDRMVIFAGLDSLSLRNDTWALSLAGMPTWTQLSPTGTPPVARSGHTAIYDPVRDRMIVFAGSDGSSYRNDTWALSLAATPGWVQLLSDGPSRRQGHTSIYDPVRDRMVILGGAGQPSRLNDTWALQLSGTLNWNAIVPSGTPPTGSEGHTAIYDPVRDRMVIFGGAIRNDVWEMSFTAPAWLHITPSGALPGPRWHHSAIYDPIRDQMLAFAGSDNSGYLGDTWTLSLSGTPMWSQPWPLTGPPGPRRNHATISDPVRDRLLVFGGSAGSIFLNDTWELSFAETMPTWRELTTSGTPPSPRYGHSAIYDAGRDRMLVFGGYDGSYRNDCWALSLTATPEWVELAPLGSPPSARYGHSAIYDTQHDRMLVFGGNAGGTRRGDTWELTLTGQPVWTPLSPAGNGPSGRTAHTAIYDPVRRRMIVFAGDRYSNPHHQNDTWELSLVGAPTWMQLSPAGALPTPRRRHTAIYDPIRDRMVIFGGERFVTYEYLSNDTWALPLAGSPAWTQLLPAGTLPAPREAHTAVYDQARDRMIVFAGGSNNKSDTWALTWGTPGPAPPLAPSDLSVTLQCPPRANLTWQDNSDDEAFFEIQVQVNSSGTWFDEATVPENTTSWTSGALSFGNACEYRVRAGRGAWCSDWVTAPPEEVSGPCITQVLPETVTWLDTGIDLLIEGSGFELTSSVIFTPPLPNQLTHFWNDGQLHVSADLEGAIQPDVLNIQVSNTDGRLSNTQPLTVSRVSIPHPRDFAPTFWFAAEEDWYPVSPFFVDPAGSTQYTTAADRKNAYLGFQDRTDRRQCATVYYWVHGSHLNEPLVTFPGTDDPCYVYEYWLYYLFDDYAYRGVPVNKHQHDWERFFVFVRVGDSQVVAVASTAHLQQTPGNAYVFSPYRQPFQPDVIVEKGSHANCPDIDGDHAYTPGTDVNQCRYLAWGIKDAVSDPNTRVPISGPGGSSPSYRLVSLESLRSLVDRPGLTDTWYDDNTREAYCAACNVCSASIEALMLADPPRSRTFSGSESQPPDDGNWWVETLRATSCSRDGCWQPSLHWYIGHKPVEHAWEGAQAEYLSQPLKAVPSCLVEGVTLGVTASGALALLYGDVMCRSILKTKNGETQPFGYSVVNSEGTVGFNNPPEGLYTFMLDADGAAPYQQTLQVSSGGASLGVNGDIVLVPEDSSFTLRTSLVAADSVPIVWAKVQVFIEDGTPVAESLTDPAGLTWTSLHSAKRYKVIIHYDRFVDSVTTITASAGDTVATSFRTPFQIVDVQDGPPLVNSLRQNYPNPFNPATTIEFELERQQGIRLEILDVRGQLVRRLRAGTVDHGVHREFWDGCDRHGRRVPSGVYICRLKGEGFTRSTKLVLAR